MQRKRWLVLTAGVVAVLAGQFFIIRGLIGYRTEQTILGVVVAVLGLVVIATSRTIGPPPR